MYLNERLAPCSNHYNHYWIRLSTTTSKFIVVRHHRQSLSSTYHQINKTRTYGSKSIVKVESMRATNLTTSRPTPSWYTLITCIAVRRFNSGLEQDAALHTRRRRRFTIICTIVVSHVRTVLTHIHLYSHDMIDMWTWPGNEWCFVFSYY